MSQESRMLVAAVEEQQSDKVRVKNTDHVREYRRRAGNKEADCKRQGILPPVFLRFKQTFT